METSCLRHTELPHTSRLFADFVYHFDRVAPFYAPASFEEAVAAIDYPVERRAALVAALRKQNGNSPALERLAQPGTLAVTTGQQVGLFSGPAYTIYKALTAVKLARQLTERGIPAVPVFWLSTEDHDLAEVNHCWVFDKDHRPVALSIDGGDGTPQAVGNIALGPAPVAALREALAALPHGDEVSQLVEESYAPGRTMGEAFAALLKRLLGPYDLLYIDPLEPAVRAIAAPLLRQAALAADDLKARVLQRNRELEAAGYHAQVHVEPETSFFFLLEDGRRIKTEGRAEDAERLSPNALLRPVMQDYILPTVAYVGGPAELAYLAQAETLYRALLGRMPVAVARSGFTLLDARSSKLIERYGLAPQDFFHGEEALRERISMKLIPASLRERLEETTAQTAQALDRLRAEMAGFDASLTAALDKSRAKMLYQLSKTERKVARELFHRSERAAADAAYVSNLVYPHKHLQERFYTILPFLARHGLDLIDRLYENVHLDCPDHLCAKIT